MFKKEALNMALQLWKKGGFTVRFWDGTEKAMVQPLQSLKLFSNRNPPSLHRN